jgi:DNA-binding Lrp family transcriptional regulator
MDEIDQRLISALREDSRQSTAKLGRRLGISRTTVQSRIERLERRGAITGYTIRQSEDFERRFVRAQIMITVHPKAAMLVEVAMRGLASVRMVQAVSGPFDMIAHAICPTTEEMDALVDAIGRLEGVERTTTSIVLSTKFER